MALTADLYTVLGGILVGAAAGFIVAYALRKILLMLLVCAGLFILGLLVLVNSRIAMVDFPALWQLLAKLFVYGLDVEDAVAGKVFSGLPFTLGLLSGLFAGFLESGFRLKLLQLGALPEDSRKRRVLRRA